MGTSISLALIIKNVEKTIDRCLTDFSQCSDEIIVVDTGSADNSLDIVKKYTDKIYHFKWIDDFSAARNFSFEKCTKDFVLWVDGDDYATPETLKEIREIDYSNKEIIICDYVYGKDAYGKDALIVPRERIIKRSLGLKWQGKIHEYLPLHGKVWKTDIKTYHNKQQGTSERNLAILEKVVEQEPTSRYIYYLAKEYLDFGRIDESIEYFNKYLEFKDTFWEDVYTAYFKLAVCYFHKGDESNFKDNIFKSLKIEDRWSEPYYHIGLWYMNKCQWTKAIHWFEIAYHTKRPHELCASYLPEYNTWLPCLNLAVCYHAIGDLQKAYEYNNEVLRYRKDPRAIGNNELLAIALKKSKELKDGQGKKLNIGCGNRSVEGYINADIFEGSIVDEVFDIDDIPYKDGTISTIHTEHVLEHVPFKRAEKAIKEWFRVLQPGGEVILYMPDFERCCQTYLSAPLNDPNFMSTRAWYKMTIYGIQESQAGEPDDAQIHKCGFSKEEIRIVLERNGFQVISVENYGGPGQKPDYGTPSMMIRALKAAGGPKIGWICEENWIAAQTRIRVLRVNEWLRNHGYMSSLVSFSEILEKNYDIAIVGKRFDESTLNEIKILKQHGKKVYCDLCESIFQFPYVSDIIKLCDKVICCSRVLAEEVASINSNVTVIEDAWE